ncbi:hypothetical protein HDV02_004891 [Globomyces sp. JEL0801]|nr:hypothetical protein HDV02_004891 [Globomyces sp. JEL0801]
MGPSGAGKTTFLNVLLDRVYHSSGRVFLNGVEGRLSQYRKLLGFVPQEDIMLPELTVRENIYHSCRMRSQNNWNSDQVSNYVDVILKSLDLWDVQNSIIGDEEDRGVSGGQKKRVNIGMELAGLPLALFLDEPTSGLDATAALNIATMLKQIASLNLTTVAVIHQPRVEIYNQMDDILLLIPGGRTAYHGPKAHIEEYFIKLGYEFADRKNPADLLMDIVSGEVDTRDGYINHSASDLATYWEEFKFKSRSELAVGISSMSRRIFRIDATNSADGHSATNSDDPNGSLLESDSNVIDSSILSQLAANKTANGFVQFYYCLTRSFTQQWRKLTNLITEIIVSIICGAIVGSTTASKSGRLYSGVFVQPFELISPSSKERDPVVAYFYIGLLVCIACASSGCNVFGTELGIFERETNAGHNRTAYFLAKTISVIPRILMSSLHFTGVWYALVNPRISFLNMYCMIFFNYYCVWGISAVVSVMARQRSHAILATTISVLPALYCGSSPLLSEDSSVNRAILNLSFNRYAAEFFYSLELDNYKDVYQIDTVSAKYSGYTLNRPYFDLLVMFGFGTFLRTLSYFALIFCNRGKHL